MRHWIACIVVGLLLATAPASAQSAAAPVPPTAKLVWDMIPVGTAPNLQPPLTEVQGYSYRYYLDASTVGQLVTGVVCVATDQLKYTCSAPMPAFTPGPHTLTLLARSPTLGDSAHSPEFKFAMAFVVTPAALRVQ